MLYEVITTVPVAGEDLQAAQLRQFQQRGAVGFVVAKAAGETLQVDIEQRCLEDPPQQDVAGDGAALDQVDEVALGMSWTGKDPDSQTVGDDRLLDDMKPLGGPGEDPVLFDDLPEAPYLVPGEPHPRQLLLDVRQPPFVVAQLEGVITSYSIHYTKLYDAYGHVNNATYFTYLEVARTKLRNNFV